MSHKVTDYDPLLYGAGKTQGIVAVEISDKKGEVKLFIREKESVRQETRPFNPYIVFASESVSSLPGSNKERAFAGRAELDRIAYFDDWKACEEARKWLAKESGFSPGSPNAPYLYIRDPVQQYLEISGETLFKGMEFGDLCRMQLDIECITAPGYEFCNADRAEDVIVAVGVGLPDGSEELISSPDLTEKAILERLVDIIAETDPDVIEGHNIFNFDLPYIVTRAKRHKVKLSFGRDGSTPAHRPSRLTLAERNFSYERFEIYGRQIVDSLFLVHAYDISHRALKGFGLKDAAVHFGLAPAGRTYIEGSKITEAYSNDPESLLKYLRDDVIETRSLSSLLSVSSFLQTQMLPYSYQNVAVRGNATKIDSLLIRAYLSSEESLPVPGEARAFAGGYTDMFITGVVDNVHHCDVRSLYPSLMLSRDIGPKTDRLKVFLKMLSVLKDFRLSAKKQMNDAKERDRNYFDALQSTFKVLINSFYGYLGFGQGRFSDFDAAENVTADGRELLQDMIASLREMGAEPIEIDTDGIYFIPPGEALTGDKSNAEFREQFSKTLPEGIDVEFDGEYKAMFSYKMKNYALLCNDGEVIIKGGALKSRGLEPFLRSFLEEIIRLILQRKDSDIAALRDGYEKAIINEEWHISHLAKTETLQDSPDRYAAKIEKSKRNRSAVYELALRSDREYRQGDQISYYVTGTKKSVAVYDNCRLTSEWSAEDRDENKAYYISKLDALFRKFSKVEGPRQGELNLT